MRDLPFDAQERIALCDLLGELGAQAPTLLAGWTTRDLAAHLVLRERDPVAGLCLVLPGPFERFAERRRVRLAGRAEFGWLVARLRSGPPPGFFRIGWVRSFPSLNEFFVHHEDVRRANGLGPRDTLTPAFDEALWRNVRRGGRYLSRRLREVGLEIVWAGTGERVMIRNAEPTVRLGGAPGEVLLYLFGRRAAAQVELHGPADAVAIVRHTHFGM
ncbi:TIGR03085 family metal-binding protein [Nocardia pseudovaccinii]|uniref:TIGR03085 family metal-binding protein n=1 Tax=Nocardia pseudovaccinii TaxID=189540 RepID=UPI003D8AFB8F